MKNPLLLGQLLGWFDNRSIQKGHNDRPCDCTRPDASDSGGEGDGSPVMEADLDRADEIFRVAFGTFLGAPEPKTFFGTADYVRTRWAADPQAAFAAVVDGELVGSNFATNWGSVGFFGPLTVRPDLWDQGIGNSLMEPVMDCFETWGNRHLGLFTFSHSPKHIELYRRYGFWPRFLTAVMNKQIVASTVSRGRVTFSYVVRHRAARLLECLSRTDRQGVRGPGPGTRDHGGRHAGTR